MDYYYGFVMACYLRSCMACMQMFFISIFVEDCHGHMDHLHDCKMDCFCGKKVGDRGMSLGTMKQHNERRVVRWDFFNGLE